MKHVFQKAFLMPKTLVLTLLLLSVSGSIIAQPDTIYAIGQIAPYEVNNLDSLNFPLKLAEPIGDVTITHKRKTADLVVSGSVVSGSTPRKHSG